MKIGAAQTRPITGDVAANLARHLDLVEGAVAAGVDFIVFPELSLTGYEPTLAASLAAAPEDPRLEVLQEISDRTGIAIAAGMPTRHDDGVRISLLIFRRRQPRHVYSKTFLHADEVPVFVAGRSSPGIEIGGKTLALAICYETSVTEHWQTCLAVRPVAYVASVAKSPRHILGSHTRLAELARTGAFPVLMANSVGPADGSECVGQSAVWDQRGTRLHSLRQADEGLLVFDTESGDVSVLP